MIDYEKIFNDKKSILITGETGVGKTSFVKKLTSQFNSARPFVSVNLSGVPDQFFESELYGYKKGAFTGAINSRNGLLKTAANGVVFLDEIGDLSHVQQLKILKLIDEKMYYPIGEDEPQFFQGQFIFATHKNLKELVEKGEFREDLYYRIEGLTINIKPLRMKRNRIRSHLAPMKHKITDQCFSYLCDEYAWPGNIRELNKIKDQIEYIKLDQLFDEIALGISKEDAGRGIALIHNDSYYEALSVFEAEFFKEKLSKYNGKLNLTSEIIGLSKSTLIAKLRKYGINNLEIKALSQKPLFAQALKSA